jgi:ABC-2 type transport system ATP-binding protein
MSYTVTAVGITKSFASHLVLDHVDLAVEAGSVFALLGPNGAGKTTMVRILATLVRPDEGTATVAGHDLVSDPIGVKRSISLTGQFAAIDELLTGEENIEMMAKLRHLPRRAARARTDELLASFELNDIRHRRAGTYSGGMRRRLDLAISMIERPELLFLDEPSSGLDPRSREQLWGTVRRLVDDGATILLTTQYLEEADELADTIALLDSGRIIAQGSPDDLKSSLGGEVLRLDFADDISYERALGCLGSARSDQRLRSIEVVTDGTAAHVHTTLSRLAGAGASARRVSTHRPSLDDVFLALTGAQPSQPEAKEVA